MKRASSLFVIFVLFTLVPILFANPLPQTPQDTLVLKRLIKVTNELELKIELEKYVDQLTLQYSETRVPQEKFLIALMWLINREMSRRLENPKQARQAYFNDLHRMLEEISQLKARLRTANITDLNTFVNDLEDKIQTTLKAGEINVKKKKVFEDALQLLYVAEETIKLDQSRAGAPQISQKISQSKEKLMSAFGEVPTEAMPATTKPPTVYDLFNEWKKTDLVKYELRLTDVKLVRQSLLKTAGLEPILRMFNDELRYAYEEYNFGEYDFADRLFEDIAETYPNWGIKNLDDVYYYWAESNFALNRYLRAQRIYEELLKKYPTTSYLSNAYSRLIEINYHLKNYPKVIEYADFYRNIASTDNPNYGDIQFLIALSYYENQNYDQAVDAFLNIPQTHPYYPLAQYFMGNAYAAAQLYDEAQSVYSNLIQVTSTPPEIYARAAYKLACLSYERKSYLQAIQYLSSIPATFDRYDKVLNALAWSYFEYERSKPPEEAKNYEPAKTYAQLLVDKYYASPYIMEAKSLLAYINQINEEPVEAIDLYREVYKTKATRREVDAYIQERERLRNLYYDAQNMREQALIQNNAEGYARATDLVERLENQLQALELSEASGVGSAAYEEIEAMVSQLETLNRMRQEAVQNENKEALKKIDSLAVRLTAVLSTFPIEYIERARSFNMFDKYPLTKWVAEESYKYNNMSDKRLDISEEMARVDATLQDLDEQIAVARAEKNFGLAVRLEQDRDRLVELKKRFDEIFTSTYQIPATENPYPEFSRWGDLGAFGIINVHFDQKKKIEDLSKRIAASFEVVNKQITERKEVIEDKIKKIEAEIRFMTMRARMEERLRLRAERERAFRESYFDTRRSEVETEQKEE